MGNSISLTFDTAKLLAALREVRDVVERRNTIVICSSVLIEAGPDGATLTTTDLDIMIRRNVECEATSYPVRFAIDANRLADVVAAFPAGSQTVIDYEAPGAVVKAGRSRTRFSTQEASDFPILTSGDMATQFTMPGKSLFEAFGAVRHAISREETRYYLNGIFMHTRDATLRFAATDGHRLARLIVACPTGAETIPDVIVSTKTVDIARKLAESRGDSAIEISATKDKMMFAAGDVTLIAKAIDGTFPDYERVIPSSTNLEARVDRDSLAEAAARIAVTLSDKVRVAKLVFSGSTLSLQATSHEHGEAVDAVGCEFDGKDTFEIGFNLAYLRAALDALPVDTVRFAMVDSAGPSIVTSAVPGELTLVLMPMRV